MAERDYAPDQWSDHDFFLITRPMAQEALRQDLRWLPAFERIVLAFRETDHGLKVLYDDGHLVEFAVFDLEEIGVATLNRYRVLLDRGGVAERCAHVREHPRPEHDDRHLFGMVLASTLVAVGRGRRGELLSAAFFVTWTATYLTRLMARTLPATNGTLLDSADGLRRFERAYPDLGAELDAALRLAPADAGLRLLAVFERELRPRRPDLPWRAFDGVRDRLTTSSRLSPK